MSNTNEPRRNAGTGGRRLAQNQNQRQETAQRSNAPRRHTKKRSIGATIAVRLFQLLGTLVLIGVVTSAFLACYAAVFIKTSILPKATLDLSDFTINENSVIYYTDKDTGLSVELATLVGEKNSEWVNLEDVPQDLIDAFVAVEDKTFWTHHGVNWYRTGGAVLNMFLRMNDTYGGSTITQQLIKNLTQYDDVTVTRKVLEIFTALDVERNYSKEEIMELYLNVIYMGSNCWGVQAASQKYFGKDVSELSLAECASLAGITNNPSLYGPNSTIRVSRYQCSECEKWTSTKTEYCPNCGAENSLGEEVVWTARDYNKSRQETILYLMWDPDGTNGTSYITEEEYNAAVAETLVFADDNDDDDGAAGSSDVYSWYVEAVISEVLADLQADGYSKTAATQLLYSGGLSIYTNYDPDVQAVVDEIYNDRSNLDYTSKTGQQMKSAITIVDNSTGYVVALAGDIGEKTASRISNYATSSFQPGSSFKPLSVYAPALEMGLITPATVIDDNPVELKEDGTAWPSNDGSSYKGLTTIQTGVAKSLNTIALRTLRQVTPEASFQFLTERFGLTTLIEGKQINGAWKTDIDESPLAMGGLTYGVSTYEMAAAFATFPRNGLYTPPTTYSKVEDSNNKVLLDNTYTAEPVIKTSTAYYMNQLLTNAVQTGTGTPAKITGMTVAGKTGTTTDSKARWFAGYTPYYTGVVWVGYATPEEIVVKGNNPAVVLWQKVMSLLHEDLENKPFDTDGIETVTRDICLDCGKLAVAGVCDNDVRGSRVKSFTFVKGDEPAESCTCHVPIEICTDSPILDASGNETGLYYLAGEFCPEESRKTVYVVDWDREQVIEASKIADYTALKSYYDSLENPNCPLHDENWQDPNELPTEDPNWPGVDWPDWDWPDWPIWPWESSEPTLPPEPPEPVEPPSQEPGEPSVPIPED